MPSRRSPRISARHHPHRTAGATAVGARPVLVAYNVWVSSVTVAQRVAQRVRGPMVRALGLAVGDRAQVSCNLVEPAQLGPAEVYDLVAGLVDQEGGDGYRCRTGRPDPPGGPRGVSRRRAGPELGLSTDKTVESRLRA